eukprot:7525853-Pyramimonas_sp.AAC.1
MPRLLCPGRPSRIAAAVRDHFFVHPSWCWGSATLAMFWTTVTDSGRPQRSPRAHPVWCRESATLAMPWA